MQINISWYLNLINFIQGNLNHMFQLKLEPKIKKKTNCLIVKKYCKNFNLPKDYIEQK